jgi:hypothetical protein
MNYTTYTTQPDTGRATGKGLPVPDIAPRPAMTMLALPRFRTHIEAALSYADATHTYEDVAEMVAAGRAQFWPGPDSVIISEIVEYPQKKVLNFFIAGGHLAELERMAPKILEWGKLKGCSKATMVGRKGWQRSFLASTRWTASELVIMETPL